MENSPEALQMVYSATKDLFKAGLFIICVCVSMTMRNIYTLCISRCAPCLVISGGPTPINLSQNLFHNTEKAARTGVYGPPHRRRTRTGSLSLCSKMNRC